MKKRIIVGLDLSFNSTGITIRNEYENTLLFARVVNDVNAKEYANINTYSYTMPVNITPQELLVVDDLTNRDQLKITLQAMIAAKQINTVLKNYLSNYEHQDYEIIVSFENYIMPSFGGVNSLKNVSGLITLQGYIREFIIRYHLKDVGLRFKLITPTPKTVKKSFTGNGKADKKQMLQVFIDEYEGYKLLPEYNKLKIDDIIDSFALVCYAMQNLNK